MYKDKYRISFNTPAFLGNAEQKSVWRTPPFKALLQNCWRIVIAEKYHYDWEKIREAEGRLFGHAWLEDNKGSTWAMRSQLRIKLAQQVDGSLQNWELSKAKVHHPEAQDKKTGKPFPMSPETYLAFGPLHFKNGLVHAPAINAKEENTLLILCPQEHQESIQKALKLMHWFGTVGGRSRNGWGSIALDNMTALPTHTDLNGILRPLETCLKLDWPHALGTDKQGRVLMWQTPIQNDWRLVIKDLAQIKINFRTDLRFPQAKPDGLFHERHLLAYPVTNHSIKSLGNNGRLANQIRFKVINQNDKYLGLIFHLPCNLPKEMQKSLGHQAPLIQKQLEIWQKIHKTLDNMQDIKVERISL